MKIVRQGEGTLQQSGTFTGKTQLTRMLDAQQTGGMAVSVVHFEDGARTHWHVHPGEQVLYILEGQGRVGTVEGEETVVQSGDLVYAAPNERHWHGAMP